MTLLQLLSLIRVPMFLLIGIESIATFFLYQYGYYKYKPSTIIRMLSSLFLFLGIDMLYQAFIPFTLYTNPKAHTILTSMLPIFLIPIFICVRGFRMSSIMEDGETLKTRKVKNDTTKEIQPE